MSLFKRILLPTNFSELAAHAAVFARGLAEEYSATLYVLHACQPVVSPAPAVGPELGVGVVALAPNEAELQAELRTFVRVALGGICVPIATELRAGPPAQVITDYAREAAVDLIVMGTHARGGVTRFFLGSVSKAVMEHAGCPVLMVPLTAAAPDEPRPDPAEIVAAGRGYGAF